MSDSDPNLPENEEEEAPSAAELEAAGQNSMFGGDDMGGPARAPAPAPTPEPAAPTPAPAETNQPYRVLARKYRPQTFSELIGQEPMVRTLANAIERDRLAHAFLMTGVRGVGKTSTARLIAKALNCVGPDGNGGPTIDPCGVCEYCTAIAEGRHIDVIEMDAASHTGVDDVREIIEQVRYAAVSARYKIYIIDEVHMLSRNAFNALLKTLEEPPAHVKFLFATTEVEKLPVTVLSRTQRFDLRRIPAELLAEHFGKICALEGVEAEEEALRIIAAAAEGSVRDGLSILDQAIAHADMDASGGVSAERVRDMLGLADKGAQRRILGDLLHGDAKALLAGIDEQYALGVEPLALMRNLMDLVHRITVAQVSGGEADAPSEEERAALSEFAQKLGAGELHRLWQLLLKGHEEVRLAPDPLVALQMALLRVLHAAEMPDPGKLLKRIEEIAANGPSSAPAGPSQASAPAGEGGPASVASAPAQSLDWAELVERVDAGGHLRVAQIMRDRVRVIEISDGRLIFEQADDYPEDPVPDIRDCLFKLTGKRWQIERGSGGAQPSLREAEEAEAKATKDRIRAHPLVQATLEAFPEGELIDPEDNVARASNAGRNWN
ncbi:DNA polymerase III subunit gamma/tau [Erythrobacter sp. SCSIO 43205]|uniref:DNA polymerase III subunit gamma/tau n=1 Tax=Erythrobacter sp. SCSIO 43205 TaxID=2779361 RepID=UPI001CA9CEF9|nr:DNA polymerase III subunit gamma/tau [Erythrobacter sp. SCSIO 43205]UAB76817.1 DNA polymerase III subunit gamma/tau [Erythrobacter sp. SCSIO 43205]